MRLLVKFCDFCSHLDGTSALSVPIVGDVYAAACQEVGEELEGLALEVADGRLADFAEVVGKNLSTHAHGDTLCSLCQEERKFHGQGNGLAVASVVGQFPFRRLGVEQNVKGQFGESGLNVSGSGGSVAGEDVAPVTLRIDEEFLLPHLYERIAYAGIAVGVKLHGVPHDVGHLVVASVVQAVHRVQDAPLYGFQSVAHVGDGALQDDVAGIVEKPVLVHARQLGLHGGVLLCLLLRGRFV